MDIIRQFKALSDPTRLRLLNMLASYELNVNEIVSIVGMIQSGVSRHLKILLEAGLLVSRKEGSFIYYSADRTGDTAELIRFAIERVRETDPYSKDLSSADQSIILRKNRAKRFFRTVAPQWDRLKKEVLGDLDLNSLLEERIKDCRVVADLGCGTGEMLQRLLSRGNAPLIGVDASPEMLEQAKIRLPDAQGLELRLGELENLPMRDQEVNGVVMSMVLYHIVEPEKSIREVARVLKPDGIFVLADFSHHDQEKIKELIGGSWLGFTRDQIESWLGSCGLEPMEYQTFPVAKDLEITLYLARKTKEVA